ncbi:hypothetical protein M0805_000100 [Coniferiporia weirii]|nr:hypothetical protein M0805_000100 [Coniferiporia weirii]
MAALPSFVELMSSLGLSTDSASPGSSSLPPRASSQSPFSSPSSSPSASPYLSHAPSRPQVVREPSPTIVVSQYETPDKKGEFKRRASSGNIKAARFSPYSSTPRRGSVSALSDYNGDLERPRTSSRRSSASSSASKAPSAPPPVPPLPVRRSRRGSLERLNITATSCTPISSFARRRSPHSSPTSPTFAQHRSRSTSAELPSPVMLPTLPPMLAESFAAFSFPMPATKSSGNGAWDRKSRSPFLSPMELSTDETTFVKHHQAGLRISSIHRQIAPIA